MCRQTKMRKPILYEREFKLPPFRTRPKWGTPRVGKGGGGGVLALVEHVERLDRAEPWPWLRERGLLAGGGPGGRVGLGARRGRRRRAGAIRGVPDSGPTPENRSTGRIGFSVSPAEGPKRDPRLERAQTAWTYAAPIPTDP